MNGTCDTESGHDDVLLQHGEDHRVSMQCKAQYGAKSYSTCLNHDRLNAYVSMYLLFVFLEVKVSNHLGTYNLFLTQVPCCYLGSVERRELKMHLGDECSTLELPVNGAHASHYDGLYIL
jgi:hypothetical protein